LTAAPRFERPAPIAAAAAVALAGFALVVARASLLGLTYDEAYTYFHYVGAPLGVVVGFGGGAEANNHTLNSLLMTASVRLLGSSELALRLPNVLAYVGYAAAVLAIGRRLRHGLAELALAVLLLLNPFVIELFSMARGYGLALAFAAGSLVSLMPRTLPDGERGRPLRGALLAACAVLASLTFLDFFLPVWIAALWSGRASRAAGERRSGADSRILGIVSVGAAVAAYAGLAIWRLRARAQLYYGGGRGFWADTVDSLIRCTLYLRPYASGARTVLWILVLLALGAAAWLAARDRRERSLRLILGILAGGCLLGVVAHVLLGAPFRINRTAAWIVPVFLVVVGLLLDRGLDSPSRGIRGATAAGCVLAAACGAGHFAASANTRYAILQLHDADTRELVLDLERLHSERRLEHGTRVFASWELRPSLDYYRTRRGLVWLAPADDAAHAGVAFVAPREAGTVTGMRVAKTYPMTGNVLFVREP
jgi:hypothetical protein